MMHQREQHLLLKELDEVVPFLKECGAILAGGAITALFTNARVRDWDLYFRDLESIKKACEVFSAHGEVTFETDTAITYKWGQRKKSFQIIKHPSIIGSPLHIFESFDFTICMGSYDFAADEFVLHQNFLKHLAQRRLVFHVGTRFPICSILRILKYQKRGYSISGVEMLKATLAVHRLEMETYADVREQLMGIDTAFLRELTDKFKEEPFKEEKFDFEKMMQLIDDYMTNHTPHLSTEEGEEL